MRVARITIANGQHGGVGSYGVGSVLQSPPITTKHRADHFAVDADIVNKEFVETIENQNGRMFAEPVLQPLDCNLILSRQSGDPDTPVLEQVPEQPAGRFSR